MQFDLVSDGKTKRPTRQAQKNEDSEPFLWAPALNWFAINYERELVVRGYHKTAPVDRIYIVRTVHRKGGYITFTFI